MMTNEQIRKSLNELRIISPDPEYKRAARAMILGHKPEKKMFPGVLFLRLTGATALLILVVTALSFELSPTPVLSSSFNPNYLQQELEGLTINVQIEEAGYREEANRAIASALNEIENTNVKHLNNSLLQSEVKNIDLQDGTNPEIDALLETVIF